MRIFYASIDTANPALDSRIWRRNLYEGLVGMGCDVVEFDFPLRETFRNLDPSDEKQAEFISSQRPKLGNEILRQIQYAHGISKINMFFSYFYDACVEPEIIDAIKNMGILTVNWYCNSTHQFELVRNIAPHYDWCLVPEKARLESYREIGAKPIYCQMAANPRFYHPTGERQDLSVSFVGQAYGERPELARFLVQNGIDIRVFGPQWEYFLDPSVRGRLGWLRRMMRRLPFLDGNGDAAEHSEHDEHAPHWLPAGIFGGIPDDSEMVSVFNRSKINLGFGACDVAQKSPRVLQMRLRDFEIPMCGGFYLTEYFEELSEFYRIGKEIECYRDKGEMLDKIRYYLSHDTERERIRRAGHERCLREHTWEKRFAEAFKTMGVMEAK